MELFIDQADFINILMANLDAPGFNPFEAFSSSKNVYKGTIRDNRFEITRKRRWFDTNFSIIKTKGNFMHASGKLIIDMEVNAFRNVMIPSLVFFVILYGILFSSFFFFFDLRREMIFVSALILILHAMFALGLLYFNLRKGVRTTKYEIGRDLLFMMRYKLKGIPKDGQAAS